MSECQYILRCKNNTKCYRCNNCNLLKLPKGYDNTPKSSFKRIDRKKANADNSWEDLEQTMVDKLKSIPTTEEIRRSRASGALWFEKSDVLHPIVNLECKERKGNELKSGTKSISIQKLWLDKATSEALDRNRVMALPFRFKGDDKEYIIMNSDDIISLINTVMAYKIDNDVKTKEIELLTKKVQDKH